MFQMEHVVYTRPVQYYETDRMQIVHHSNYIRWLEEIRVAFMAAHGMPYDKLEAEGILMPVVDVTCQYHSPLQFGDTFSATCRITAYNGVRLSLAYEIYKEGSDRCCVTGTSQHCFTNELRKPLRLQGHNPALHTLFLSLTEPETT
jgi:acyl-CoA thioester hydrolase